MTSRNIRAELGDPCRSSTAGLAASPAVMKDNSVPLERRSRCRVGRRFGLMLRLRLPKVRSQIFRRKIRSRRWSFSVGYHERLGARPMCDATKLLIRNALAHHLLHGGA